MTTLTVSLVSRQQALDATRGGSDDGDNATQARRATALAPKYARLQALIEKCAQRVEGDEGSSQVQKLQLQAINLSENASTPPSELRTPWRRRLRWE